MKAETKYKGAITLSVIGDALGWITEFEKSKDSLEKKYGSDVIDRFYNWQKNVGGKFYGYVDEMEEGSYSDDTQLMLCVARSIKTNGDVDNVYFSKRELPNWLYYARGGGRTVKNAADKISRKSAYWFSNFFSYKVEGKTHDYRNMGANGAAMRVLPICLANLSDREKIRNEVFKNSIITHGHPRAIIGAMLFALTINEIITHNPDGFSWETFLTILGKDVIAGLELPTSNSNEIQEWISEWNKGSKQSFEEAYSTTLIETRDLLRKCYQFLKSDIDSKEAYRQFGCFDPDTKGSGIATVIAAIYLALKYHFKPIESVREAVNQLGSDTDTIASFTGAIIGALHGQSIIPEKWKKVQDLKYIDSISEYLISVSEGNANESLILDQTSDSFVENEIWDFKINDEVFFDPLGTGIIYNSTSQKTFTKGKLTKIIDVLFSSGQSCRFTKIQSDNDQTLNTEQDEIKSLLINFSVENSEELLKILEKKSFTKKDILYIIRLLKP